MGNKIKYSLVQPAPEAQLNEILQKIRLSMNGIVSEQMTRGGIIYKQNYGVSIPRIKEIAAGYHPDHYLSQRLWQLQIRETMILATLLEPVDTFTAEIAREWVSQFNQIEIVEQASMNLFCRLSYADRLCLECIQSEDEWTQITGFILVSRIVGKLNHNQIELVIQRSLKLSLTDDLHLFRAIALALSRLCRKDKETATTILKEVEAFSEKYSNGRVYISAEVKQEILFLNIL